jgi:8-oxo-dGTP pyrophosphatase MutT (NUDIX family)
MQAVKRKMYEEIGYEIDTERLVFLNIYDDIFGESIYENITLQNVTITYVYLLDDKADNIKPNDSQHDEFKFFDINDKDLHDRVKIRIKDLLDSNIIDNGN